MKLSPHTYQAWWDLHAWAGVIASLFAYAMFFFGVCALFRDDIRVWQEVRAPLPTLEQVDQVVSAQMERGVVAADKRVRIYLPQQRSAAYALRYTDAAGETQERYIEGGALVEPRSDLADFLYGLHFFLFPGGPRWLYTLAGLAAAVLLLVVITGLLIHLQTVVRQFHQFRPKKRLRVAWLDAHKVLGTMGLPFALVYALTGAWMALDSVVTSPAEALVFDGDRARSKLAMRGEREQEQAPHAPSGAPPRLSLRALLDRAQALPGVEACRTMNLRASGTDAATVELYCGERDLTLSQRDGRLLNDSAATPKVLAARIAEVPYAMHFIDFGAAPLRVLYALLGVAACIMILTGNWLWVARRPHGALRWLVQRLTIAVGGGTLLASAAAMFANRLAVSAAFEREVFWCSWLLASVLALVIERSRAAWHILLVSAAATAILTMLLSVLHPVDVGWLEGARAARAVDLTLLGLGVGLLALSRRLRSLPLDAPAKAA